MLVISIFRRWMCVGACAAAVLLCVSGARAQRAGDKKTEPAPPEDITLKVKDGVRLRCKYYPGCNGKDTIPIMVIHGWKGKGAEFTSLAQTLQDPTYGGHAVIVPDLRGHGGSTKMYLRGDDDPIELDPDRFRPNDFKKMLADLETVKKFLVEQHNDQQLNIDRLCVIGSEMGAVLAVYWSAQDWSWPLLAGARQGQDVKALVLISPLKQFKGAKILQSMKDRAIQTEISMMILHGGIRAETSTARLIYQSLEKTDSKHGLYEKSFDTTLQGAKLLEQRELRVPEYIASFVRKELVEAPGEHGWEPRNIVND